MPEISSNPNDLNNPNDKFFKGAVSLIEVARPLVEETMPPEILDKFDLDTLEIDPNSYINDELKENFSDVVWSCRLKNSNRRRKIAFLFEHKSYKPAYPHFQIMDYQRGAWRMQIAGGNTPERIVPIVFYHGTEKWVYESFESYFDDADDVEPEFLQFSPSFNFILINLQDYTVERIQAFKSVYLQKTFLAFKHYKNIEYLKQHILELLFYGYNKRKDEKRRMFVRMFVVYLTTISGMSRQEIIEKAKNSNNNLKSESMTIIDEFIQEGIEIGEERATRKQKLNIYNAWKQGYQPELLANVFSLSLKEVNDIIEEMKTEMENDALQS